MLIFVCRCSQEIFRKDSSLSHCTQAIFGRETSSNTQSGLSTCSRILDAISELINNIHVFCVFPLLNAFAKFRKTIISFVMSYVRPSVLSSISLPVRTSIRLSVRMEKLSSHWTGFHEIQYLSIFRKHVKKIHVSLKYNKNNGTLHEDQCTFVIVSR